MPRDIGFRVYLITDRRLFSGIDGLLEGVEEALKGGVRAVQVREKDLPTRELLSLSYRMRDVTGRYGASLFINDRADIALAVGAEGVHLGQAGMPVRAVRKVLPDDMLIGVSTHSVEEALQAEEEKADFITIGPVFPTPSKLRYGAPIGLETVRAVRERVSVPMFGIGGIKSDNVREVMETGVNGIALISGILSAPDRRHAAESFNSLWGSEE